MSDLAPPPHRLRAIWEASALDAGSGAFVAGLRRAAGQSEMRIGFFTETTWRPIALYLEGDLLLEGVRPNFSHFEYEALHAALATAAAGTPDAELDVAIVSLDAPARYAEIFDGASAPSAGAIERVAEACAAPVRLAARRARAVYALLPPSAPSRPYPLQRTALGDGLFERSARLRAALVERVANDPSIEWIDPDPWERELGRAALYDPRLWELGRIRYSPLGFRRIARDLSQRILHARGAGVKAVILDLDNTLWGGVLGEVGRAGIEIGDDYPGSCYRAFQEELLAWKRAGIALATASKNDREHALAALAGHPRMSLRPDDFVHHEIHWEPKPASVARLLEKLGISADAVLFIDDNPRERLAVAEAFPALRIFDFPEDPIDLVARLRALPWPLFASGGDEGRRRAELHAQQDARRAAVECAGDRREYLRSLGAELEIRVDARSDLDRIVELHRKTNQFNTNPLRLGAAEIASAMDARDRRVLACRYRDRFGDAGLIGCAVAGRDGETIRIETFILSCRVIGLGIEQALLAAVGAAFDDAADREWRFLEISYQPTERNEPARRFLAELGDLARAQARGALTLNREGLPTAPEWLRLAPEERVPS